MLDNLSNRLQDIFGGLKQKGRLSEDDINSAMREIRLALLEADVNYKVVKKFVNQTREKSLTSEVMDSLTPAQNVIKIVTDELTALLGSTESKLELSNRIPNVIMLVGLQGSGKTTAAAKLAYLLKKQKHTPLLVACDVYRPAAADQLEVLGQEIDVKVFRGSSNNPVEIAKSGVQFAIDELCDIVIVDTAGRLHVDEDMMNEASEIKHAISPDQILMVVDAMTGQDVVNVVQAFAEKVDFDGVIMSKMDGDARGGGALSIREITGKPIKFISSGEKPNSLEVFHPDRMAKRILGMGDVMSLIESAVEAQELEAERLNAEREFDGRLTMDDFIEVNRQIKRMGGVSKLISALPGGNKALGSGQVDENLFDRMNVIINSMSREERNKPEILNGSRRKRIALGAGVTVHDVNELVKKFNETKKMFKSFMPNGDFSSIKGKNKKKKGKRTSIKRRNLGIPGLGGNSFADLEKLVQQFDENSK